MRTTKEEREKPVLLAFESEFHYNVWCPHCIDWHRHGKTNGLRAAHCTNPNSPYIETGYVVKKGAKIDYIEQQGENR